MIDFKKRADKIRVICNAIYNEPFVWDIIKSYAFFAVAIPIAKSFDGVMILP
ncbi:uncharacterized protein LOC111065392 [Drosophila obscura]|uniref:uncharacterized protein LOC111065392 n=1 Tax=Drosophila obscura TaxID=7282 RepID=UPI000BA10BF8|nr:uncharacterized protein LOC111065392 [Drosophila obscura]